MATNEADRVRLEKSVELLFSEATKDSFRKGFIEGFDLGKNTGVIQGIDLFATVLENEGFNKYAIGHLLRLVEELRHADEPAKAPDKV